jgi:PAS domain S-box-containing protein
MKATKLLDTIRFQDNNDEKPGEDEIQKWQIDFLEAIPHKVSLLDTQGNLIKCNERWQQYIGDGEHGKSGCIEKTIIHPDDFLKTNEKWNDAINTGKPFEIQHRLRRFDEVYRWHLGKAQPIRDRDGKISFWIWTNTDINEQIQAQEELLRSEKKLREKEEKYQTIFSHSPVIYARVDKNLRYEWLLNQHSDFKHSDLIGKRDDEIDSSPGIIPLVQLKQDVINNGVEKRQEITFGLSDGPKTYDITATPIFDEEDQVVGLITAGLDVTERKQAEDELIKTKTVLANERELLETIYDTIPIMLTVWEPTLNVLHVNKYFEEITGWTEQDIQEKDLLELVYPDPKYREKVRQYMSSLTPGFKDIDMTTKSGEVLESSWANVKISDGRNVGIGIDIGARKAFEQKLLDITHKLHTMIDNITDGVMVFSPDGEIIEMNKAIKRIMAPLAENPEKPHADSLRFFDHLGNFVPADQWPTHRCLRSERFIKEEYHVVNKNTGKSAYLEYSGIPVINKNKLSMAILTIHDVTERKNDHLQIMQANLDLNKKNLLLQKLNQFQENLLYVIAHDLRGAIANMYMLLDLMKSITNENERQDFLANLSQMVRRQEDIINGLVELMEMQSEKEHQPAVIQLEELVKDIVEENDALLKACEGTVIYTFEDAPALNHIPGYIASVIRKLITNSIKYHREGVPLIIEIDSSIKDDYLLIRFRDNGIGIDMERHGKHMFRPFKRFSSNAKGIGISLYIVKIMIEENGGHIEVASHPSQGTCFSCYFRPYDEEIRKPEIK